MKAKLVRIGNSRGIRLPKPMIEEAGLDDEVDIRVLDRSIIIASAEAPRTGWELAAKTLSDRRGSGLLDVSTPTRFDEEEWTW